MGHAVVSRVVEISNPKGFLSMIILIAIIDCRDGRKFPAGFGWLVFPPIEIDIVIKTAGTIEMHQLGLYAKHRKHQTGSMQNWGPLLFVLVLMALLGFFYWLLIYSGGVTGHGSQSL